MEQRRTGHSALCELNYTPERPDGSLAAVAVALSPIAEADTAESAKNYGLHT